MRRLLALLCGLFVVVIATELSHGADATDPSSHGSSNATRVASVANKPIAPAASLLEHWEEVTLARPLFAPDRKPVTGSMAVDAGLPRLAGIISFAHDAVAIFQPVGNGKPLLVRHGDMVSGWEATKIAGNAVSLRKAGDRIVLRPEFEDKKGGLGNNAKQPPSRWEVAAPTGLMRARWSNPQLQP